MVDFPKLVNQVYDDGSRIFIELGPQSSCTKWVGESLKGKEHLAVSINRKGADDYTSLLRLAAKLTSHGVAMNLEKLFPRPVKQAEKAKPALIKPVVLGKKPFADVILTDENRKKFTPQKKVLKPAAVEKPVIAQIAKPEIKKIAEPVRAPIKSVAKAIIQETKIPVSNYSKNSNTSESYHSISNSKSMENSFMPTYQSEMLQKMFQHNINISEMHADFMQSRSQGLQTLSNMVFDSINNPDAHQFVHTASAATQFSVATAPQVQKQLFPTEYSTPQQILYTEQDLREVAYGKIGKVFGSDYDIIDTYSRRVMLPMDPYLLVTRVTEMQATKGQYKPSKMTTEYDIPHNAWYSTDGQIPTCICIESGQCDLLLISYMGIDFENKGQYVYRLLDCTLTFLDDQPKEGQTLRYEISINSFAQHKNNLLFFFSYECFVGDKMILKM
ncbi:MAG: hypothetical protein KAI17_13595, partial [Thiotrichaceae bacterium]|nr:hypothetical protein [Thiotrichaceae bacterium]